MHQFLQAYQSKKYISGLNVFYFHLDALMKMSIQSSYSSKIKTVYIRIRGSAYKQLLDVIIVYAQAKEDRNHSTE